ncbi:MAG: HAD-IA family hydrolase [Gammaproteobacteria bacterium]|nr:HAD-IA family hydrolase [Gammaproteobacteria bacterium]
MSDKTVKAVLWDFGGVLSSSPFEAFNRFEQAHGLPKHFIRTVNTNNPNANAWALLERNDITTDEFSDMFEAESAALGHAIAGRKILALLDGDIRPQMVTALTSIASRYKTACLTNNVRRGHGPGMSRNTEKAAQVAKIMALFDFVIESSKVGVRKPEPKLYAMACEQLDIEPAEAVYLDDLGINLKPARAMGMQTIKVGDPDTALAQLEGMLGHPLQVSNAAGVESEHRQT